MSREQRLYVRDSCKAASSTTLYDNLDESPLLLSEELPDNSTEFSGQAAAEIAHYTAGLNQMAEYDEHGELVTGDEQPFPLNTLERELAANKRVSGGDGTFGSSFEYSTSSSYSASTVQDPNVGALHSGSVSNPEWRAAGVSGSGYDSVDIGMSRKGKVATTRTQVERTQKVVTRQRQSSDHARHAELRNIPRPDRNTKGGPPRGAGAARVRRRRSQGKKDRSKDEEFEAILADLQSCAGTSTTHSEARSSQSGASSSHYANPSGVEITVTDVSLDNEQGLDTGQTQHSSAGHEASRSSGHFDSSSSFVKDDNKVLAQSNRNVVSNPSREDPDYVAMSGQMSASAASGQSSVTRMEKKTVVMETTRQSSSNRSSQGSIIADELAARNVHASPRQSGSFVSESTDGQIVSGESHSSAQAGRSRPVGVIVETDNMQTGHSPRQSTHESGSFASGQMSSASSHKQASASFASSSASSYQQVQQSGSSSRSQHEAQIAGQQSQYDSQQQANRDSNRFSTASNKSDTSLLEQANMIASGQVSSGQAAGYKSSSQVQTRSSSGQVESRSYSGQTQSMSSSSHEGARSSSGFEAPRSSVGQEGSRSSGNYEAKSASGQTGSSSSRSFSGQTESSSAAGQRTSSAHDSGIFFESSEHAVSAQHAASTHGSPPPALDGTPASQTEAPPPYTEGTHGFHLSYVDFSPKCLDDGGILQTPKFETFDVLMARANAWLKKSPSVKAKCLETIESRMEDVSTGTTANTKRASFIEAEAQKTTHVYVRSLRMWVMPRGYSDPSSTQQIGYINVVPACKDPGGISSRPAFDSLPDTVDKLNKLLKTRPLPGPVMCIETLNHKFRQFGKWIDPDRCHCRDYSDVATSYLMTLRIYYVVGQTRNEQFGYQDVIPEPKGDPSFFQSQSFDEFDNLVMRANVWIKGHTSDLHTVNIESVNWKFKTAKSGRRSTIKTDKTINTFYGTPNQLQFLRVWYASSTQAPPLPPMDTSTWRQSRYNPKNVVCKTFCPSHTSTGGLFTTPTYELLTETREKMKDWLNERPEFTVISAETVHLKIDPSAPFYERSLQTYFPGNRDITWCWISVFRLFLEGELPPEPAYPVNLIVERDPSESGSGLGCGGSKSSCTIS